MFFFAVRIARASGVNSGGDGFDEQPGDFAGGPSRSTGAVETDHAAEGGYRSHSSAFR